MQNKLAKCVTPNCPNMSYHVRCLSCSIEEASRKSQQAAEGICIHSHSITGDIGMVMRLLPEYKGGPPQPGYMLDVCKACLKELEERPYNAYAMHLARRH
jgi:hypothetical protein